MVALTINSGDRVIVPQPGSADQFSVIHDIAQRPRIEITVPNEVMIMIARHLSKSDWKALRLVSRDFLGISLDLPLFTEVWISPYAEDLAVFTSICGNPGLAKHVTSLILDTTSFWGEGGLDINKVNVRNDSDDIIALRRHMKESLSFQKCQQDLLIKVVTSLKRLPKVQSLLLRCGFASWLNVRLGMDDTDGHDMPVSPLARSWPQLHYLDPFYYNGSSESFILAHYFDFAAACIAKSAGKFKSLDLLPAPKSLGPLASVADMNIPHGKVAFSAIQSLRIHCAVLGTLRKEYDQGFVQLFKAATSLQKLDLSLTSLRRHPHRLTSEDNLLARLFHEHTLPSLVDLRLGFFATETKTLCRIFDSHQGLKRVYLKQLVLIDRNKKWIDEVTKLCREKLSLDAFRVHDPLKRPARHHLEGGCYQSTTRGWGVWDD